jgi:hypothetical protein
MSPDVARLVSKIHDAGLVPEAWPEALNALSDTWGAAGAAMIISRKTPTPIDWVCFSGLSAAFQSKYIDHYALLDPFSPLLRVSPGWMKLSECLPRSALLRSEWYNDFVLPCGIDDALGTCFIDTPSHSAFFGLHQQIGRRFQELRYLNRVKEALTLASLRHVRSLFGPLHDDGSTQTITEDTRYYFHVVNGRQYRDVAGRVFRTREEATAHASVLASELARDKGWAGFTVFLTADDGEIVARIPVSYQEALTSAMMAEQLYRD